MKIVRTPEKKQLPESIRKECCLNGAAAQSYIEFHRELALKELERLCSTYGVARAAEPRMVSDDWGDGMKVMEVSIDTLKGRRVKLQWHDFNQAFMQVVDGLGACDLFERDLE
jgi:hypothetical protein